MFSKLKNIFIGRPLKSSNEGEEENLLTKLQALAMLSSDALSSIAYGPEQVVLVLVSVSAGAIWWSLPIGIVVLILLASLTDSCLSTRWWGLYGYNGKSFTKSWSDFRW